MLILDQAYIAPDGEPRLFRPKMNMERLAKSAARVALPVSPSSFPRAFRDENLTWDQPIDPEAVLELLQQLIRVERRWIPTKPGCSLYIRPTIIGTRDALGVAASDSSLLYIVVTPMGPYFKGVTGGISLLAISDTVRAWPGGTGGYKLGLNYASGFAPQQAAQKQGYDQILWLFDQKLTEVGAMNIFVIVQRDDGGK